MYICIIEARMKKAVLLLMCAALVLSSAAAQTVAVTGAGGNAAQQSASPKLEFLRALQNHLNKNDIDAALDSFDAMSADLQDDADLQIIHASLLVSVGREKEAEEIGDALQKKYAGNIDVLELNAQIAAANGNTAKRDSIVQEILKIDPSNANANILQAERYALGRNFKLANNFYKKALESEPQNLTALFGYGQTAFYIDEQNFNGLAESQKTLEQVLALDPNYAPAYFYLGKIAAEKQNYSSAMKYAEQAVAADSSNYDYYIDLGTYQSYLQKTGEAEQSWTKAISLEPDYFLAYTYRAELYKTQKKFDDALADFKQAAATNPDYYFAFESIGELEWRGQNWAASREAFQNALEKNSGNYSYQMMIAATYLKEKNLEACRKFLTPIMRGLSRTSIEYEMMRLYLEGGVNAENALRSKLDKIDNSTERGRMWFYMGLYYELAGSAAANEYYAKVAEMNAPLFFECDIAAWNLER